MAGVQFSHPDISNPLNIRLGPSSIDWSYELVTSTTPTYAGEVVQILAIRFTNFTIEGQFGKEGAHGSEIVNDKLVRRPTDQLRDFGSTSRYAIGLTQMTEFFRQYFAIASQGHDVQVKGHYNQQPITIHYEGASDIGIATNNSEVWKVYPTSFPSYARSKENYAPKWRVVCEVYEAPEDVKMATQAEVLQQLSGTDANAFRPGIGYRPFNKFSDPFDPTGYGRDPNNPLVGLSPSQKLALYATAQAQANKNVDKLFSDWRAMVPAYDDASLNKLLSIGGSVPISDDLTAYTATDHINTAPNEPH